MKRKSKVDLDRIASVLDRLEEVWNKAARDAKEPKAFSNRVPKVEHARVGRYKRQGRA